MSRAEAVVDLDAIRANVAGMASTTRAQILAVVKADGYGHGIVASARAALDGGATWLGVCTLDEAAVLRAAGVTAPVLAWLLTPGEDLAAAIVGNIDLSVSSAWSLRETTAAARATGRTARVHLKVDSGLSRNGATVADWPDLVDSAAHAESSGEIEVIGVWSHLAYADDPGHPTTAAQLATFDRALEVAARSGVVPQLRHIANSAATLTLPEAHYDLVRPGIACYGLSPVPAVSDFGLRPAMTLRAPVALAKRIAAGSGVSYGHRYRVERDSTVALVPLGYADGVPRAATNVAEVWVGGRRRRIAGTVCMDQFVVDVGDDDVSAGDEVVLFGTGDHGEPTVQEWAEALQTISYEIVSRVGARVPRVYTGLSA